MYIHVYTKHVWKFHYSTTTEKANMFNIVIAMNVIQLALFFNIIFLSIILAFDRN